MRLPGFWGEQATAGDMLLAGQQHMNGPGINAGDGFQGHVSTHVQPAVMQMPSC